MAESGNPANDGAAVKVSESEEVRAEAFFRDKPFQWRRPRFTVYRPADPRPRVGLNRYPHNVIGVAVVLFGKCWGVTWKRARR